MLWTLRSLPARSLWSRTCLRTNIHPDRSFTFTSNHHLPRVLQSTLASSNPLPSFREQVARETGVVSFSEIVKRPPIRNQILFFAFGSFVAFSVAAKLTNADTVACLQQLRELGKPRWQLSLNDQMRNLRYVNLAKRMQSWLGSIRDTVESFPTSIRSMIAYSYIQVFQPILNAPEGRRMCWAIGTLNVVVWLAWRFPRLNPFMMRNFTHNPLSGLSFTMLTSTFSHSGFFHLLFNSMALASFGSAAYTYLAREQDKVQTRMPESSARWHLLAFLITGGLFSSLVSHVAASRIIYPRLIAQIKAGTAKEAQRNILPSLGISGAVYSAVTLTALAFPESEISMAIPPTFPIPIQWGVGGMVALDLLGVLRGWRLFDHYAHLGGAAFGVLYYAYGPQFWEFLRLVNLPPKLKPKS